jgi:hypothetical protein
MSSLTEERREALRTACEGLDGAGLREVIEVVRSWLDGADRQAAWEFRPGDAVTFETKGRGTFRGTVVKVLGKNVRVKVTEGPPFCDPRYLGEWRVAASILRRLDLADAVALAAKASQ